MQPRSSMVNLRGAAHTAARHRACPCGRCSGDPGRPGHRCAERPTAAVLIWRPFWLGAAAQACGRIVMQDTSSQQDIDHKIAQVAQRFSGAVALAARNLATGEEMRYNADKVYATASTIKLAVLI